MSLARRSLQVVAFLCTLLVGVTSMAVIVTQTAWFKEWLRGFIVRQAEDYVNGQLAIGRLDGNLFFGVELEGVDVTVNGRKVVDIKDLGLDYSMFTFLRGSVVLDHIRINQPKLLLAQTDQGWNLANLIKARTPADPNRKKRPIEIGEIGISDGSLDVETQAVGTSGFELPSRIERLDASIGVKSNEEELRVNVAHLSLRATDRDFGVNALSGVIRQSQQNVTLEHVSLRTEESSIRVDGTVKNTRSATPIIDIKASSDKLTLAEIAKVVPALRGYVMQPAFEVTTSGPLDRLAVDINAREATLGGVIGDLTVDGAGPQKRVAGTVTLSHFNFAPLIRQTEPVPPPSTLKSDITGEARIDLALPSDRLPLSGTYAVKAVDVQVAGYEARNVVANGRIDGPSIQVNAKAAAYGGNATAIGTVKTGTPLALDLKGHASNLDLRNLPSSLSVPRVPSTLSVDYTVSGRGPVFSGDVRFDPSTLAGATIAKDTVAHFRVGGGAPQYTATGQVAKLDVQQIGKGFAINALAADRFHSRLNATFNVTGAGGGRYPLTLDATGSVVDSEMFGASFPSLDFTTNLAGGDAHVTATGRFANLDPAVVSGNEKLAGMLTGDLNVDTTIRAYSSGVTLDSLELAGRVNLTNSTIADVGIDSAAVDGRFANREGVVNELSVTGADVNVTGKGAIALNETGASDLTLHIETPSLARVGTIVNQPLTGGASVDATVNGNGKQLIVYGTLIGSNIGQGENTALALNSNFDVTIPDLDTAATTVHANTSATFLKVGGQEINAFTTDTTYTMNNLIFSATANQQARRLDAGGNVVFHPDHQEIHLPDLVLRTQEIEWRTAPGTEAALQYGKSRIAVDNIQLVNGDQRIVADGVFGSPGEALNVKMENVDVSQLNQLALRDPEQVSGRLTANAVITGPTNAPDVKADFSLAPGMFQQFTFESLGGTIGYGSTGLDLDVKLQQTPSAWLTAKGHAPLTLFRSTPPDDDPARGEGGAVDLQVASSEINLAVVEGFTSYIRGVTGTLQANFKVTGTGYDPRLDGAIAVVGGGFEVPDLGTAYTGLDTRIELQPDAVKIAEMRILDNHGSALTVGGELAVRERAVGAVNVNLKSTDFKVIDNELGNVRIDTDVRLTGEVRYPRVEGRMDLSTGTLDVARLLERFTSSVYSTESAALPGEDAADAVARVRRNAEIPADADAKKPLAGADTAVNSREVTDEDPAGVGAPAPAPPATSLFDSLYLNVEVGIPDDLVLKGQDVKAGGVGVSIGDVNITVGGDIGIRKTFGDTVRIDGDVRTIRGTYAFQGRRFEIMRDGRIRFTGTDEIDPILDLEARRLISGVEAFIRVRGTMRMPELSFRSNPPLDEGDVLALIIFNQPINELGEGEQVSLAQRAGDLAGGYLASGLARSIGSALNLSEFEIQATGENGSGPTVTLGQQVGRNLFFRVRQAFGNAQATELILEYQLARFLRLQASAAESSGGTQRIQFRRVERGGIDLIFFFAY